MHARSHTHDGTLGIEGIYIALFVVSLVLGGLSERFGVSWLLPLAILYVVGLVWAAFSRRY